MIKSLKNKDNIISLILIAIVSTLVIIGLIFHEPWFDEAQAYLIARDASWHDIFFFWPHYEGHPPLWHIILKLAIKLGLPYELTIKAINFLFFEAVLFLIEFRSPFSRITRTLIPLSYFLLYQYSVISRPYILLMLSVLLTAMLYKDRYNKPVVYCFSLIFMCSLHSYGIAFAGGIVIADLLSEAFHKHSIKKCIMNVISNKKLLISYVILLTIAVFLIINIIPRSDTYASEDISIKKHSYLFCLLLSFLFIPSETLITSYSSDVYLMQSEINPLYETLTAALFSLMLWICLFFIGKKRKMLFELFVPYFFLSILTSVYIMPHHFGMFLIYLLYVLWISLDKEKIKTEIIAQIFEKAKISLKLAKIIMFGAAMIFSSINLYWSGCCYYTDFNSAYYPSKDLAKWIKSKNLTNKKFLAGWYIYPIGQCISANPYFDHIFYYGPFDSYSFITHILPSEEEKKEEIARIRSKGNPDFIICNNPFFTHEICEELNIKAEYTAVAYSLPASRVFKDRKETINTYIVCTNETYKELYGKDYKVPTFERK
ncbi:hypothetical protein [Ruminococcus flavefaciens]|uniref:Dolichyl-phosphate-mannose-protein mannosyltransferase n=1 Tax=Ruminococcus flavefaciens TaxID=1265 RepID=A0A1K1N562_RUMFL|nr:hypothetical protein [Ruminococcus flavefaciens]SFW30483.1 hypothetical protein SAMN02910280_1726 [Ruminococcus flavefaciens]